MSTILVLGGYGGFGARLSRRLAAAGHDVLVAGRRLERAEAFCAGTPRFHPVEADRTKDLAPVLARHRPDLVIDAAGPFQGSGYAVAQACIEARTPYLDLADATAFVTGIASLDASARQAGVAAIAGASSVPALSGAVVRHLASELDRVTAVEMAISASNRATAGPSVAAAILGAVGRPLTLWRGQRSETRFGWQELRRETFAVAGHPPLRGRWTALTDVPDLALLPNRVPGRPGVTFRAGTELAFQNLVLWVASWPVRWGWIASVRPLASALLPLQRLTGRLGTDRSAMRVRVFGLQGTRRVERRWTLIAEDGDGPEIPTLAAAVLADRVLHGAVSPGARDAGESLELSDFA
ncbi:MAG: saccharopine dehydrogenase NADP-binding domain-containing protein, partial [Pseudomonadota bacterium]